MSSLSSGDFAALQRAFSQFVSVLLDAETIVSQVMERIFRFIDDVSRRLRAQQIMQDLRIRRNLLIPGTLVSASVFKTV